MVQSKMETPQTSDFAELTVNIMASIGQSTMNEVTGQVVLTEMQKSSEHETKKCAEPYTFSPIGLKPLKAIPISNSLFCSKTSGI